MASPHTERVYVGKRGGKESIKQKQIDEILVDLCSQVREWLDYVVVTKNPQSRLL